MKQGSQNNKPLFHKIWRTQLNEWWSDLQKFEQSLIDMNQMREDDGFPLLPRNHEYNQFQYFKLKELNQIQTKKSDLQKQEIENWASPTLKNNWPILSPVYTNVYGFP